MTKTLAELEQELIDHTNRAKYLEGAIKDAEELIKTHRDEHRQIMGGFNGWGKIKATQENIAKAKLLIADGELVHPVFTLRVDEEAAYVVTRVTPKRLYYRECGRSSEWYTSLDGVNPNYWANSHGLDTPATLERFNKGVTLNDPK